MRPNIFKCYLDQQVEMLVRTRNISEEEATTFVKSVVKERLKYPEIRTLHTVRPGYIEERDMTFKEFIDTTSSNILTPSGRIYISPDVKPSTMRLFIDDLSASRKYHKDKMFMYQQQGNKDYCLMENQAQTLDKVLANSLTAGAKNSPYNSFYDKPGFNAITSVARLMIKTAFTPCEQLLGNYWHFIDTEDVLQHISLCLRNMPDKNKLSDVINKYNLYVPSVKDLSDRFKYFICLYEMGPVYTKKEKILNFIELYKTNTVNLHNKMALAEKLLHPESSKISVNDEYLVDMSIVDDVLLKLSQEELTFIFYVYNFRELCWSNEKLFKPWLRDLVDRDNLDITDVIKDKKVVSKIPRLDSFFNISFEEYLKGKDFNEEFENNDIFARSMTAFAQKVNKKVEAISDLFSIFLKPSFSIRRAPNKHTIWRKTTNGSDTDSILYTLKEWAYWIAGDYFNNDPVTIRQLEFLNFMLNDCIEHMMYKFSTHLGAIEKDKKLLNFKNEYFFVTMTIFRMKKHYAGPIAYQEGRILPELKLDIKGLNLRGSHIVSMLQNFLKELILNTDKRVSATSIIKKTIHYERHLHDDLMKNGLTFLKTASIKQAHEYSKPDSSDWVYLDMWNTVFGQKYGEINAPLKTPIVYLQKITDDHINIIRGIDPVIAEKFNTYVKSRKRDLNAVAINLLTQRIPEELLVVADLRKHIYTMMKAVFLTAESFGLPVLYPSNMLLMSDYYLETDLKLSNKDDDED